MRLVIGFLISGLMVSMLAGCDWNTSTSGFFTDSSAESGTLIDQALAWLEYNSS